MAELTDPRMSIANHIGALTIANHELAATVRQNEQRIAELEKEVADLKARAERALPVAA